MTRSFARSGRFAALLALACQLALAASVPQPVLLWLGLTPICHADASGHAPGRSRLPPVRMIGAVGVALTLTPAPPAAPPILPVARARWSVIAPRATMPRIVAAPRRRAAFARAPPIPI